MDEINILLETASNHCNKGDFKQGIHLYSQYIKQNNQDPKAYYQRGKAYFKIKDYNAAISDLNKAMQLAPDDAHLTSERGLIYFMAKKEDKAISDFDKAVELEPENPFRYASRAFIKDRLNDLEGAKADYQKALELDPEDAISYNNLGLVLDKMGHKKKADDNFEKAATIDPKNFGMSNAQKKAESEVPEKKQDLPPMPEVGQDKAPSHSVNFINTIKELAKSKKERKNFWEFVKNKFSS